MNLDRAAPLLFFLTGAGGLVYQTVWMRMLIRVFGVTVHATTTVVAVFMIGLALGAALASRFAGARPSLRRWGVVELAAGVAALGTTFALRALPGFWGAVSADVDGAAQLALRVLLAAACLMPPTVLMGATLPLLVSWSEAGPDARRSVSTLYGANTLGAVLGVLAVGFVTMSLFGEMGSVLCAVAIHVSVGALAVAFPSPRERQAPVEEGGARDETSLSPHLLLAIAGLTGFCALACEIAWTRLLVFVVGSSVYGFSAMLSMYLLGIGVGSFFAPRIRPAFLAALLAALGLAALMSLRVYLVLGLAMDDAHFLYSPLIAPWSVLQFLATSAAVVLPMTFVSGMTFPVLVRAAAQRAGTSSARAVGRIYAWNTLGSVLGSLVAGFVLMPRIGAQGTVYVAGMLLLVGAVAIALSSGQLRQRASAIVAGVCVVLVMVLPPSDDVTLQIVGRRVGRHLGLNIVRHVESIDTTVTVAAGGARSAELLLNGIQTSSVTRAGEAMAHIPLAVQPSPSKALVICFGVGATYVAASRHVPHVDVVELVGEVITSFPVFQPANAHYLERPGNRIFVDDGRNFLLRSKEKWDAIMIDGAPPIYSAGFVNLYSKEMMVLVRDHLEETGVLMLWMPTLSFPDDIWGITRAVQEVFPHTTMWTFSMSGYILLASKSPFDLSRETLEKNLARQNVASFAPWINTKLLLEEGRFIDDATLRRSTANVAPVTDDHPHTEYPLNRMLRNEPFLLEPQDLFSVPSPAP